MKNDTNDSHRDEDEQKIAALESEQNVETPADQDETPDEEPATPDATKEHPTAAPDQPEEKHRNLNKYFLYTLVGGLIVSALISVVAVLIGEFNSTMSKALGTTITMVLHTMLALVLVSSTKRRNTVDAIFFNTLLVITLASFVTSILGIWAVISGQLTLDLYLLYFYTLVASIWIQLLLKIGENLLDKPTRIVSFVSIGFTAVFYVLLLPTIFTHYPARLPEILYRVLAASVILLATSSVLVTVFRRIFVAKHPEMKSEPSVKNGLDIIVACIVLFMGVPLITGIVLSIVAYNSYGSSSHSDDYKTSYNDETSTRYESDESLESGGFKKYSFGTNGISFKAPTHWNVSETDVPASSKGSENELNYQIRASVNPETDAEGSYPLILMAVGSIDGVLQREYGSDLTDTSRGVSVKTQDTTWHNDTAKKVTVTITGNSVNPQSTTTYLYVQVANRVYRLPTYDIPFTLDDTETIDASDWRQFVDSIDITLA